MCIDLIETDGAFRNKRFSEIVKRERNICEQITIPASPV